MISTKELQKEEIFVITYQKTRCNKAFGKLYEMFYEPLFDYVNKIAANTDDAFDITQEAFIKAAQEIDSLKVPITFRFWLFKIARNMCMKNFKKLAKESCDWYEEDEFSQDYDTTEAQEREEILNKLAFILNQLSSQEQKLLMEKYVNGKSIKELMQETEMGSSAIKMKLKRARSKVFNGMASA